MNCRNCNTPVARHARSCPNCGRSVAASLGNSGQSQARIPGSTTLSPSNAREEDEELPLQDELPSEESPPESTASRSGGGLPYRKARVAGAVAKPSPDRSGPSTSNEASSSEATPDEKSAQGASTGLPTPDEVKEMIRDRPELLEPGLSVERDAKGRLIGAGLETDVGEIDLLARDDAGGLVVVMVPDSEDAKDVVGDVLQRVGWVRKRHAKKGQDVRGVVIMGRVPDDLAYAAAAVSDTVSFKTVRLSVTFDDVDL